MQCLVELLNRPSEEELVSESILDTFMQLSFVINI